MEPEPRALGWTRGLVVVGEAHYPFFIFSTKLEGGRPSKLKPCPWGRPWGSFHQLGGLLGEGKDMWTLRMYVILKRSFSKSFSSYILRLFFNFVALTSQKSKHTQL